MAINSSARDYWLGQMARVPELRGALSQIGGNSSNASNLSSEFQRLNPQNYVRYDPTKSIEDYGFRIGDQNPFKWAIKSSNDDSTGPNPNPTSRDIEQMLIDLEVERANTPWPNSAQNKEKFSTREKELQEQLGTLQAAEEKTRRQSTPGLWYGGGDDEIYQKLRGDLQTLGSSGQNLGQNTFYYPHKKGRTATTQFAGYDAPYVEGDETDFLARALAEYGVKDLKDIGVTQNDKGESIFYNQTTGQGLPKNLFTGYHDGTKAVTNYGLSVLPDGTIAPVYNSVYTSNSGRKSNSLGNLAKIAGIAGSFFLPGVGAALGTSLGGIGATAGTALAGAGLGAATSALSGGDVLKGALMGGVGGGLGAHLSSPSSMLGGISNPVVRGAASGALSGAVKGGLGAGLYGGDVGKGILGGGITGGLSSFGGAAMGGDPNTMLGKLTGYAGSTLGQRVGGQLAGQLVGSPFEQQQAQQAPRQQVVRPAAPAPIPAWLPQHAQDAIRRAQGVV